MKVPAQFDFLVQKASGNHGGKFARQPTILVVHFTAGASLDSAVAWLRTPASVASAHWVLGQDGNGVQLVPNDTVAWHAGKSRWGNLTGLNRLSWGLELVNPGPCTMHNGSWYAGGKPCPAPYVGAHKNPSCKATHWAPFPQAQLDAAVRLARLLDVVEIVGHDDIAPDRKIDPGPSFDMDWFRRSVLEENPRP